MFKQGRDGLQDWKNILGTFNYRSILSVNSDLNCVISNCITWIQYMVQENSSNASLGYNKGSRKWQ
jgi:GTP:adenosylcobinamide-phosphate guanylyltransferase